MKRRPRRRARRRNPTPYWLTFGLVASGLVVAFYGLKKLAGPAQLSP